MNIHRTNIIIRDKVHSFYINVRILFSSIYRSFVDYALVATYYGANCVYIVFIGASIKDVINYEFGIDWDVRIYIAMSLIPVLMVGQVSRIKWFFKLNFYYSTEWDYQSYSNTVNSLNFIKNSITHSHKIFSQIPAKNLPEIPGKTPSEKGGEE
jgi:hypothetical protein